MIIGKVESYQVYTCIESQKNVYHIQVIDCSNDSACLTTNRYLLTIMASYDKSGYVKLTVVRQKFGGSRQLLLAACELWPEHIFECLHQDGVITYVQNYQLAASEKMWGVNPIDHRSADAAT